jgi:hypothetical protein
MDTLHEDLYTLYIDGLFSELEFFTGEFKGNQNSHSLFNKYFSKIIPIMK